MRTSGPNSIEDFCRRIGFSPDPRQRELLEIEGRRVILNCTRQWGKSTLAAAKAVWQASTDPDSLILVLSPSARQSGEFLLKAARFVRKLGIKPKGDGDNEISLAFPSGSRIVGLPGNEATTRGFSAVRLILIDEASRVPDEIYLAARPMLAVAAGHLWLMSTPCGKRGFFHQVWTAGGDHWTRIAVPATDCPRISPEFLAEERRALGDRWFRQEYLCDFTETEDALFPHDDIMATLDYTLKPLRW